MEITVVNQTANAAATFPATGETIKWRGQRMRLRLYQLEPLGQIQLRYSIARSPEHGGRNSPCHESRSRSSPCCCAVDAHRGFLIRVRAAPDPRIRARRCRRGCLRLAGVRTPSILKKFVKVLEQRKPKGVSRPNRRHFLRPPGPRRVVPFRRHLEDAVMELMKAGVLYLPLF
jgi:hypothetical protein